MNKPCQQCGKFHQGNYPHALNDLMAQVYRMDIGIDPRYAKILQSHKFQELAMQPFHLDPTYNVPLVAGNSKDFGTMFVDKDLKPTDNGIDIIPYLAVHERTEWPLMHKFGLTYEQAHPIAEKVEEAVVKLDRKLPLKKYNAHYTQAIKTDAKELTNLPPDLDPKPYVDEGMTAVVKRLKA